MEAISYHRQDDALVFAQKTIQQQAQALIDLAARLPESFQLALDTLDACRGSVIVTGMGKAGLVGQKISATLCSTGTRSHFLHPAEAIHGDLGRVSSDDQILALSMSGETEEIVRLLPSLRQLSAGIISITSSAGNSLAKSSDCVLDLGRLIEVGENGLAPSTSTTAMLVLGDALALAVSRRRQFSPQDFLRFHPGGSLGRKLAKVQECMRPLSECRIAPDTGSVRETFVTLGRPGRRTGAVMIVNGNGELVGLFTDSDLARLLETQSNVSLEMPVSQVMTSEPHTVVFGTLMPTAIDKLAQNQISELPVIDKAGRPLGLIDITDVIGWLPETPDAKDDEPQLIVFPNPESTTNS